MRENCHGDGEQHCCCDQPKDCNLIEMPDGGLIHIGQDLNGGDVYLAIDKFPEGETHVGNADGDDRG